MIIDRTAPEGNVFHIMQQVRRYLDKAKRSGEWTSLHTEMMGGDYDEACAIATEATHGAITFRN